MRVEGVNEDVRSKAAAAVQSSLVGPGEGFTGSGLLAEAWRGI